MKQFSNAVIASLILTGSVSFAKVSQIPSTVQNKPHSSALSDKSLMEELTGKKQTSQVAAQPATTNLKTAPLSVQHYYAGQKALQEKNYILAIKHFNTVIKNFPTSAQVKPALLAKARAYQEMGLKAQAQRNVQLAQLKTAKPVSTAVKAPAKAGGLTSSTIERGSAVK